MAHSKSARKRIRQNEQRRLRNRRRKSAVKQSVRAFEEALGAGQSDKAAEQLRQVEAMVNEQLEPPAVAVRVEEIGNHHREPPAFRLVHEALERPLHVGLTPGTNRTEEFEHPEHLTLAALG